MARSKFQEIWRRPDVGFLEQCNGWNLVLVFCRCVAPAEGNRTVGKYKATANSDWLSVMMNIFLPERVRPACEAICISRTMGLQWYRRYAGTNTRSCTNM